MKEPPSSELLQTGGLLGDPFVLVFPSGQCHQNTTKANEPI